MDAEGNEEDADPDLLLALAEQAASQRTPGLSPAPQVCNAVDPLLFGTLPRGCRHVVGAASGMRTADMAWACKEATSLIK